jgi:hypothetical protein
MRATPDSVRKRAVPMDKRMKRSLHGGVRRDGARRASSAIDGEIRPVLMTRPPLVGSGSRWEMGVESLAARWQAALGGFHHIGTPLNR